jgi:hypothetical protein
MKDLNLKPEEVPYLVGELKSAEEGGKCAGINNVTFAEGVASWTKDISHGKLIRDGYDETLTIDPNNFQLLFQGRDPAINACYDQLPYKLGLLKLDGSKSDQ